MISSPYAVFKASDQPRFNNQMNNTTSLTLESALFYMTKAYKEKDEARKAQYQAESIRLYNLYRGGR